MAGVYFGRTKRRHRGSEGWSRGYRRAGVSRVRQRAKEEVWMYEWFRRAPPGVRKARLGARPRHMVWEGHKELAYE